MFSKQTFSKSILIILIALSGFASAEARSQINNIDLQNTSSKLAEIYTEFKNTELGNPENLTLISAFGKPNLGGLFYKAEEVDNWEYVFLLANKDPELFEQALSVNFEQGVFKEPTLLPGPPFGTVFEKLPNNMTLKQAIKILRKAGYKDGFFNVILKKTLTPIQTNHQYIFEVSHPDYRFIFVDTQTGKVSTE